VGSAEGGDVKCRNQCRIRFDRSGGARVGRNGSSATAGVTSLAVQTLPTTGAGMTLLLVIIAITFVLVGAVLLWEPVEPTPARLPVTERSSDEHHTPRLLITEHRAEPPRLNTTSISERTDRAELALQRWWDEPAGLFVEEVQGDEDASPSELDRVATCAVADPVEAVRTRNKPHPGDMRPRRMATEPNPRQNTTLRRGDVDVPSGAGAERAAAAGTSE
jgi:hypothetical protein